MNANYYNGPPGDDDPHGDALDHQCPGCAARNGERCSIDCTCGACEVEPPDADGEDFRGGERRAYEQDQQDAAWRLK